MKNKVRSYKTDEVIGNKITARLTALKRAGIGNTTDARLCMGLDCLVVKHGLKVRA